MSKNLSFLTREMAGAVWSITPQAFDHVQQLVASGQLPPATDAQVTPEASVRRVPLAPLNEALDAGYRPCQSPQYLVASRPAHTTCSIGHGFVNRDL